MACPNGRHDFSLHSILQAQGALAKHTGVPGDPSRQTQERGIKVVGGGERFGNQSIW